MSYSAAVFHAANCKLNCQENAMKDAMRNCFTDNGIDASTLNFDGGSQSGDGGGGDKGGGGMYMDSIIMRPPEEFCLKRLQFQRALECAIVSNNECYPAEMNGYMTQPDMMKLFLDQLCVNVTYRDSECIQSKQKGLTQCLERKKIQLVERLLKKSDPTKDVDKIMTYISEVSCKSVLFYMQCLKLEASSCGCNVTDLYQNLLGNILYPPSCPRPLVPSDYACRGVVVFGRSDGWVRHVALCLIAVWMLVLQ
ncbi:hypothetical protein Btru_047873 [Bulinus truncatus]|nr:hypothetical protein Btru_047873 [Bulinus truncatus]